MPQTAKPTLTYIGADGVGYCRGCGFCRRFSPGEQTCYDCNTPINAVPFSDYLAKYPVDGEEATSEELNARLLFMQYAPEGLR